MNELVARYVSPHPKPTPYEREVLTILQEEAAEIIQAASKFLRFGGEDGYPGQPRTNANDLAKEIGDLQCMVDMAAEAGLVDPAAINRARVAKHAKVLRYMQEHKP